MGDLWLSRSISEASVTDASWAPLVTCASANRRLDPDFHSPVLLSHGASSTRSPPSSATCVHNSCSSGIHYRHCPPSSSTGSKTSFCKFCCTLFHRRYPSDSEPCRQNTKLQHPTPDASFHPFSRNRSSGTSCFWSLAMEATHTAVNAQHLPATPAADGCVQTSVALFATVHLPGFNRDMPPHSILNLTPQPNHLSNLDLPLFADVFCSDPSGAPSIRTLPRRLRSASLGFTFPVLSGQRHVQLPPDLNRVLNYFPNLFSNPLQDSLPACRKHQQYRPGPPGARTRTRLLRSCPRSLRVPSTSASNDQSRRTTIDLLHPLSTKASARLLTGRTTSVPAMASPTSLRTPSSVPACPHHPSGRKVWSIIS